MSFMHLIKICKRHVTILKLGWSSKQKKKLNDVKRQLERNCVLVWDKKDKMNEVSFQLEWDSSHIMVWLLCCCGPLHAVDFTAVQSLVMTSCCTLHM